MRRGFGSEEDVGRGSAGQARELVEETGVTKAGEGDLTGAAGELGMAREGLLRDGDAAAVGEGEEEEVELAGERGEGGGGGEGEVHGRAP